MTFCFKGKCSNIYIDLTLNIFIIAGFVGTPPGVTAPLRTNTKYVVTDLACNNNFVCTNTTGSSGCGSYGGGYAAVTCGRCM